VDGLVCEDWLYCMVLRYANTLVWVCVHARCILGTLYVEW